MGKSRPFAWRPASALVLAAAAIRWRRELADLASTLVWRWNSNRRWDARALATLQLLEGRLLRARLPRPIGQTPRRWYGQLAERFSPELTDDVTRLMLLIDYAAHAPRREQHGNLWSEEEVSGTCVRLASAWRLGRLRAVHVQDNGLPKPANPEPPIPNPCSSA